MIFLSHLRITSIGVISSGNCEKALQFSLYKIPAIFQAGIFSDYSLAPLEGGNSVARTTAFAKAE